MGVTPDDLLEWTIIEDKGYVTLLNLSALSIIVQPLLGIIIPLVMWILKRDKIKLVDDTGKKLISFQITWIIVLYAVLIIATKGSFIVFNFSIFNLIPTLLTEFSFIGLVILLLYLYNIIFIILNISKSLKGLKNKYFPAIPFLK